jgi:hypothetical protein
MLSISPQFGHNKMAPREVAPRIIRHRDAPAYLGMDRNRFDLLVRPALTEIPIGVQGIGFDRLELDAWADDYIAAHGRRAARGNERWASGRQAVLLGETGSGTSIATSGDGVFAEALAQVISKKRSASSQG